MIPPTMTAEELFIHSLLDGRHSLQAIAAEFGPAPGEDQPVSLSGVPPDGLPALQSAKIIPPPGVAAYLASGDELTHKTINLMELAIERAFAVPPPWFITSMRSGTEGNNLAVDYFYLEREVGEG